jgi:hypothetical protein
MAWFILVAHDTQVRKHILCRLVLYDKVYGFGNTSLFEVGNRHDAWQGSTYNPK